MQGTYNYIPKTRHVSRAYNGAAFLWLQFIVAALLFPTINVLYFYEGWNFNSGNYLFTTDTK